LGKRREDGKELRTKGWNKEAVASLKIPNKPWPPGKKSEKICWGKGSNWGCTCRKMVKLKNSMGKRAVKKGSFFLEQSSGGEALGRVARGGKPLIGGGKLAST